MHPSDIVETLLGLDKTLATRVSVSPHMKDCTVFQPPVTLEAVSGTYSMRVLETHDDKGNLVHQSISLYGSGGRTILQATKDQSPGKGEPSYSVDPYIPYKDMVDLLMEIKLTN